MSKETKKIAQQFKKDMQAISDKSGVKISASVNGGPEHVISEPRDPSASESSHTRERFIKSAKIKGIGEPLPTLDVKYSEHVVLINDLKRKDIGAVISREGNNTIHDDLKEVFSKLAPHLALMAEMIEAPTDARYATDIDPSEYKDFLVTGFTLGGTGEFEGVTLIGLKYLSTGKALNLVTPFEKWDDSQYRFMQELEAAINECKDEVLEYLDGKMAPPAQQELELNEEPAEAE